QQVVQTGRIFYLQVSRKIVFFRICGQKRNLIIGAKNGLPIYLIMINRSKLKKLSYLLLLSLSLTACRQDNESREISEVVVEVPEVIHEEYGFVLNDFEVIRDTIRSGDNFGGIMGSHGLSGNKLHEVLQQVINIFNPAKLQVGKPYMILKARDSAYPPNYFIYENDRIGYTVVNMGDSIGAYKAEKPVTIKKKTVSGIILNNLSESMQNEGLSVTLTHELSNIYQWSIDFFKLQKGDQFKMVYNERYINEIGRT